VVRHDLAQDVVQDAFLKLCDQDPNALNSSVGAWLYRVCRNRALDVLKKEKRMQPMSTPSDRVGSAPDPAVTIAKDVKIQVEFNPATVAAYRLIGYENRMLKTEDFDDDKKDAGEIGARHCVTALYEEIPAGVESPMLPEIAAEDELKYQKRKVSKQSEGDLLTLYVRYKDPDADKSKKLTFVLNDKSERFGKMDEDFRFATAVASFGMLLRGSKFAGDSSFAAVEEIAASSLGEDRHGYRREFVDLVRMAAAIRGE
jgi:Ca-activated chloride channel family protein